MSETIETVAAPESLRGKWTSASAAEADALCQGRHRAQLGIPDKTSEAAETGNRVHAALCKGSSQGLDIDETELFDRCQKIEQDCLLRYFGPEIANLKAFPDREKRLWISWVQAGGIQHSGQPDAVFRYKTKLLVVDYKTGRDEVAVSPKNMQMRDLAVLNWVNKPLLTEIGVVVIQPWITSTPEICSYNKEDIKIAVQQMFLRVQASNNPSAPRVAGELQCKYCRAKSGCPEYAKFATSVVPIADRSIVDIPVDNWTPEQCTVFLNNYPRAFKWLEEAKDAMKELIKLKPDAVPGWTLKAGARVETITDAQKVFNRFSELGGSLETFMKCIKVGKTDLKEAVALTTKKKGKGLEAEMDKLLIECVEVSEKAPSLKKVEL